MRIWFHIKWLFKKRYKHMIGLDPAIKDKKNVVTMKYDKKYRRYYVVK